MHTKICFCKSTFDIAYFSFKKKKKPLILLLWRLGVVMAWDSLYIWWLGMGSGVECGGLVCVASVSCGFGSGDKKKKIIIIL